MAELKKMGDVKFGGTMNQAPPGKGQTGGKAGVARSQKKRPANLEPINANNMRFK
jgi:hypothetical protein